MNKVVMVLAIAVAALIAVTLLLIVRVQTLEADAAAMRKRTADDEETQRSQYDDTIKIERSHAHDLVDVRERTVTIETWISRHIRTETHSTAVVVHRAPAPTPAATGNWWCFLGRECFRTMRECSNDVDERATNCKPLESAYCNQVGRCFGDMMACLHTIDVTVSTCTQSE